MNNLFQIGNFQLHSGAKASYKIEADALTQDDWKTLAYLARTRLPPFGVVEGVPRGGLPFAEVMVPYITEGPLLICDDVLTSGGSLEEYRAGRDALGVVVFSRGGILPWVVSLFTLVPEIGET